MIRVLQVVPQFAVGGGERVAMHLLRNLDRRRFAVAGASLYQRTSSDMVHLLEDAGVEVIYMGKRSGFDLRMIFRIVEVIKRFKPDVIHTHNYVLPYILPALVLHPNKVVIHTIHSLAEYDATGANRYLNCVAFKRLGVTPVAIAAAVGESIHTVYGIAAPIVPNGIPVNEYQKTGDVGMQWRMRQGIGSDDLVFATFGHLKPVKNHVLLLNAFARIVRHFPTARCLIFGCGELTVELHRQIDHLCLQRQVELLGQRSDVPDILAATNVVVMSSDCEGSPLCIMEAMAAGRAVIATAVGGVPELMPPGTGLLVPARDVEALSSAMLKVAEKPELRTNMGIAARAFAESRFTVAAMTRRYEALYEYLLGGRAPRAC